MDAGTWVEGLTMARLQSLKMEAVVKGVIQAGLKADEIDIISFRLK